MLRDPEIVLESCEDVYAPAEDTFLLLSALQVVRDQQVLEMGCGSGILAIHCAKAGSLVTAVDINPAAVECTKYNASINDVLVNVINSDLFSAVEGRFDLIYFNPPYLRGELQDMQGRTWAGGATGTETLRAFLDQAWDHLTPAGRMAILTSSDMDQKALGMLLRPYRVRELASMRLFFEELKVLELTPADPGRPRSFF
ncbi:MAG TPA: HemK2/MTQ2 family protein methyltransferase [Methanomassiliicoccales archaeon]|nr:HemK2/MTQ2 family protein methyltransferase [Methanomassiliicoccales archaeon]